MEMTDSTNENPVLWGRLEVDNRQLVRLVHCKDVDFSARLARHGGVDSSQPLL
jgi:hypothetical protein